MVGGQVSPIINIIIKNNNNNNNNDDDDDNDDNDDNNNNSLNGFQLQFLKWGRRKVLTSTVALEVQRTLPMRTTSRPCRNEIVFITVRVRNNRTLYWNLAVIRIIGLSLKVRCCSGER